MNKNKKTILIKFGMYILSLWLLFILIFINKVSLDICPSCRFATAKELQEIATQNWLPIACVIMLALSSCAYFYFAHLINGAKSGPYVVIEVENKNSEHLVFLATYVIPLVGFGLDTARQIINLNITLVILGLIYVRTNLFYANPTLSLLGFKVYGALIEEGGRSFQVIIISKDELDIGDSINTMELDRKIFFAKKSIRISA